MCKPQLGQAKQRSRASWSRMSCFLPIRAGTRQSEAACHAFVVLQRGEPQAPLVHPGNQARVANEESVVSEERVVSVVSVVSEGCQDEEAAEAVERRHQAEHRKPMSSGAFVLGHSRRQCASQRFSSLIPMRTEPHGTPQEKPLQ
jgi:hypothetical protein